VREVLGLDNDEPGNDIFGFGKRAVLDGLLTPVDDLAGVFQRMSGVLQVTLCPKVF